MTEEMMMLFSLGRKYKRIKNSNRDKKEKIIKKVLPYTGLIIYVACCIISIK